jgi:hypothetical protein
MRGPSSHLPIRPIVRLIPVRHINALTRFCVVAGVVILATATAIAQENTAGEEPLTGRDLVTFLGPVSEKLARWQKTVETDGEIYRGEANPPVSGSIDIFICLWTWQVDLGQQPQLGGPDRLGVLVGSWTREMHEGVYSATFSFADADQRWIKVGIQSPVEADLEAPVAEVSRLPMFNASPSTPFDSVMKRKQIARFVYWVFLPSAFLASLLLPERSLRRRGASRLRRALVLAAISAAWIPFFLGLFYLSRIIQSTRVLDAGWTGLVLIPGMALACFTGAISIVVWSLLQRLLTGKGLTKPDGATIG